MAKKAFCISPASVISEKIHATRATINIATESKLIVLRFNTLLDNKAKFSRINIEIIDAKLQKKSINDDELAIDEATLHKRYKNSMNINKKGILVLLFINTHIKQQLVVNKNTILITKDTTGTLYAKGIAVVARERKKEKKKTEEIQTSFLIILLLLNKLISSNILPQLFLN